MIGMPSISWYAAMTPIAWPSRMAGSNPRSMTVRNSRSPICTGEMYSCRLPGNRARQSAWARRPRCGRMLGSLPALRAHRPSRTVRSDKDLRQSLLRRVPTVGSRARSSTGARIMPTPVARASAAIAAPVRCAIAGFHVAARLTGAGKTVPVSKPCRPSSMNSAGMPRRLCAITQLWMALD